MRTDIRFSEERRILPGGKERMLIRILGEELWQEMRETYLKNSVYRMNVEAYIRGKDEREEEKQYDIKVLWQDWKRDEQKQKQDEEDSDGESLRRYRESGFIGKRGDYTGFVDGRCVNCYRRVDVDELGICNNCREEEGQDEE